jgi:hypothetical protein
MKKFITFLCVAMLCGAVIAQDDYQQAPDEFMRPSVEELSKVGGVEAEREFQKTENFMEADKKNKDGKPIVAVGLFTATVDNPFNKQVSAKVEEILKKTQRFQMPDRLH